MWQVSSFTAVGATFWICMHKHADTQDVQLLLPVRWYSMLFWQKEMRFYLECLLGRNNIIVFLQLLFWTINMFLNAMQVKTKVIIYVYDFKKSCHSLHFSHKIYLPESHYNPSEWLSLSMQLPFISPHHQMPRTGGITL